MKDEIKHQEKPQKKGWLKKFLDWLGKGAEKSKKDGNFCSS